MKKLIPAVAAIAWLAVLSPGSATATTTLETNGHGDQVLLHNILQQRTRPFYAGTRAPGTGLGPLVPITPPGYPYGGQAVIDDRGGAVLAVSGFDYQEIEKPIFERFFVRPPGGAFEPLDLDVAGMSEVAGNARGDVVVWSRVARAFRAFRYRPAGGDFGPPIALRGRDPSFVKLLVDEDGSVTCVWREHAPAAEQVHTFEARRPPDGEFGTPTEVTGLPAYVQLYPATASNGRALLTWGEGASIMGVERPPGGHFGTPFRIADSPESFFNIHRVALAPSGAAALTFGHLHTYLAARDPSGSFERQTLSARQVGRWR